MNPQFISNLKNLSTTGGPVAPKQDMSRNAWNNETSESSSEIVKSTKLISL